MTRTMFQALALATAAFLTACSSTNTEVLPPTVNVSIGQQLIDLKKAKESGAISDKEYQSQVRNVIDSVK